MATLSKDGLTMTTHWLDFLPDSPLHRPTWRWQLANWMVATGRDVPHSYREGWVDRVRTSLTTPRRCTSYAAIREATRLFLGCGPVPKAVLEAFLLTGERVEVVSHLCSVTMPVAEAYTAVFFDVRSRLCHRDWIARHAIGSGMWVGFREDELGQVLKMFAYSGGIDLLHAVLAVCVEDKLIPRAEVPCLDTLPRVEARLRESVRVAIKVAMLPPDTSFKHLAELHLHCRRRRTRQQAVTVADRTLASLGEMLTHLTIHDLPATQCSGMESRKLVAS